MRDRRRLDDDLDREITGWVDELAARYEADGMPADARGGAPSSKPAASRR
jgi:hypothetical protein